MQTSTEQNQLKICVIEENESTRKAIVEVIAHCMPQAFIKEASNHGDGLTAITEDKFDVILINEGKPGISAFPGSKICFLIRKLSPKSRIVLMSGFARKEDAPSVVDHFLAKPPTVKELMTAVLMT